MRKFIIAAVLLVAFPCAAQAAPVEIPAEHLACETAADCVVVQTSGCSCLCMSDDFQAVNKAFAERHKAAEDCSEAALKQCAVMGMCGHPAPRCEENLCVN